MNFARARRVVRAVSGITLAKRVLISGVTIPDVTSVDWDNPLDINLLECVEAMNEETVSLGDGSAVADAPLYSRITGMKLDFKILGSTSVTNVYRWLMYKKPDGESLISSLVQTSFHSSTDSPTQREMHKMTIAKGMVISNPSTAIANLRVFVSKAALKRIAPLRENDALAFLIAKDTAGTTSLLHGMGNIYVRANA